MHYPWTLTLLVSDRNHRPMVIFYGISEFSFLPTAYTLTQASYEGKENDLRLDTG